MATRCRLHGDEVTAMHNVPEDSVAIDFEVFGSIGSGSFSNVLKCQRRETREMFACKKLNKSFKKWDNPREVCTALHLSIHPNIVRLFEVHFQRASGHVSLIYEIMDFDLMALTRGKLSQTVLPQSKIRFIMYQILAGLVHLHGNGIMHCDLKPANILLKESDYTVKLGDFGCVQLINGTIPRKPYVGTRLYRPPECILTNGYYGHEMDIWAVGCIFYELMKRQLLFKGRDEMEQYNIIENILGPPPLTVLQQYFIKNSSGDNGNLDSGPRAAARRERRQNKEKILLDLYKNRDPLTAGTNLKKTDEPDNVLNTIENLDAKSLLLDFLQYDPKLRPTAMGALWHAYFKTRDPEE